jgi:glycosyltransferase involved in cell wall biosynthesis
VRAIVYCVEAAADQHEALGFDHDKRVVIPNGFDLQRFSPHHRDDGALRRELGVAADAVLVGAIGRYHPQKDFESLVRAAGAVHRAGYKPHFVLVGRGVDNRNEGLMAALAREGIADAVHLLGEREDVERIMPALDLFVSSSRNEGFSNVLGEALASGVPSVATAIGAAPELLAGVGWVVPPGKPEQLAAAIIEAISSPLEDRRARGARGRLRMEQEYSLGRMVDQYAELYRTVAVR